MGTINEADGKIIADLEAAAERLTAARAELGRVIFGQDEVINLAMTAMLAGGHALLIGVPGLAKTKLAGALGRVFGLEEKRIQFTPDLMPADILGSEVLEENEHGRRHFRFIAGPVFCQLLMADEINRASPRTTSPSPASATTCRAPSMCWQPRTPSSRKAPIPCPRPSSTASFWRSTSAIPTSRPNGACCSPPPAPKSRN
jgi:hypothetical protein